MSYKLGFVLGSILCLISVARTGAQTLSAQNSSSFGDTVSTVRGGVAALGVYLDERINPGIELLVHAKKTAFLVEVLVASRNRYVLSVGGRQSLTKDGGAFIGGGVGTLAGAGIGYGELGVSGQMGSTVNLLVYGRGLFVSGRSDGFVPSFGIGLEFASRARGN